MAALNVPEWQQVLPGEDFFLGNILGAPLIEQFKAITLLKKLDVKTMMVYLPMVMAHMEGLFETMDDPSSMANAMQYLTLLIGQHRPLKFRFLTLITQGLHKKAWHVKLLFRSDAYEATKIEFESLERQLESLEASLRTSVSHEKEIDSAKSFTYEELLSDQTALSFWVENVLFDPKNGIELKDHQVGLRKIPESFSEGACVLFLGVRLRIHRDQASILGSRMENLGLIKKVSYLAPGATFGVGKNVFQSGLSRKSIPTITKKSKSSAVKDARASDSHFGRHSSEFDELNTIDLQITVYVDSLDLQTLSFWRDTVWLRPLEEKTDYGWVSVSHPFVALSSADLEHGETSVLHQKYFETLNSRQSALVGSRVLVQKVFSSVARPGIVSVQMAEEGTDVAESVTSFNKEAFRTFEPNVLIKAGDDLSQDMSVELMFRLFNHIWRMDREVFPDSQKVPFSYTYDVMPTGYKQGLMEVLTDVRPLNHYNWTSWVAERGSESAPLRDLMLRSAAGSFVSAYVLGCRDRHWDNIMVKHDSMLLHIDFGFVLGTVPPIDGPRFSISPDMEKAFTDVGIWNDFIDLCGKAYTSLRKHAWIIVRECFLLFRHTGLTERKIVKYLSSKDSFDSSAKDYESAEEYVRQQVRTASRQWATFMRSFAHDKVDPVYYKMLEAKFPPALLANAIMEAKDRKRKGGDVGKKDGEGTPLSGKGCPSPGRRSVPVAASPDGGLADADDKPPAGNDLSKLQDRIAAAFPFTKKK